MKKYEKILLLLWGLSILLLLFFDFPGRRGLFALITAILCASYCFGGYKLFNIDENKQYVIPILAGVALGTSIETWISSFPLDRYETDVKFLPIINVLFFIFLAIYLFVKRKSGQSLKSVKYIFYRSLVILVITTIFSYTPITFRPFNRISYNLNNGYIDIQANLQMANYLLKYNDAIDKDCNEALNYAIQANKEGLIWLFYDATDSNFLTKINSLAKVLYNDSLVVNVSNDSLFGKFIDHNEFRKMGATFMDLYYAHKCKADNQLNNDNFSVSLFQYQVAFRYLNMLDTTDQYATEQKVWVLSGLASCYSHLGQSHIGDSLITKALTLYNKLHPSPDIGLAELCINACKICAKEGAYKNSEKIGQVAIAIIKKDSLNLAYHDDLIEAYSSIGYSYLMENEIDQSISFLNKTLAMLDKSDLRYPYNLLFYGLCFQKLSQYQRADSIFKDAFQRYKTKLGINEQHTIACLLYLAPRRNCTCTL